MANKRQYTAQQMIDALIEARGMKTIAAKKLGCAYRTVQRYIDEYPTVKEAFETSHEQFGDLVELKLYEKINAGDTACIIFALKTKFRDRGYVERHEHTGKDGNNLRIELVYPDADASD